MSNNLVVNLKTKINNNELSRLQYSSEYNRSLRS
jgi:hypothetical protein